MGFLPFTWEGQPSVREAGRARRPGDILLYSVVGQHNGSASARKRVLTDLIPASTRPVAGTGATVPATRFGCPSATCPNCTAKVNV
jgi:uncharacterized repeat protein (TIGR01451 family)